VVIYENGAGGRNAGVQFWPVADDDGTIDPADVRWSVEAAAHHHPRPSLVWRPPVQRRGGHGRARC